MPPIVLFDIDLTMLTSNGAGRAAMTTTMRELTGIDEAFANMTFGGRTDWSLIRESLANTKHPCEDFPLFCRSFEERYIGHLERELAARGGEVLPGVREALAALALRPHIRIGLATGNLRRAAEMKLRAYDLWTAFAAGGFAEDGEDRADVVAAAIRRVGGGVFDGSPVYVLGDSEHDVLAAKANGATAIGVCTGSYNPASLRDAGADHVLPNLADTEVVLRIVTG